MAKLTKQEREFLQELKDNSVLPIKHYNLKPGTRLDIDSLKGLLAFETGAIKHVARRNIEYVEVVKEYDRYILVKVHTSVRLKTIHNVGTTQYYTYTEAISKYALTVNDNAYIKALE